MGLSRVRQHQKRSLLEKLTHELIGKSWWVITFILLNFCVFHPIYKHLDHGEHKLHSSLAHLSQEKESALRNNVQMKLQIESQQDPYWIEMLLKKELGLVSEGQTKVHFLTQ